MRILILDDHGAIRDTIKRHLLEINPNAEFRECSSVHEARNEYENIDFAICDLELDKGCNTNTIEDLTHDMIPVMVYSSHVNNDLVNTLKSKLIRSYVSKMSSITDLRNGIEALLKGKYYYCPIVIATKESSSEFKETDKLHLTKAQKRVLSVLNDGFSREEVANKLKNSITTVNNHIARAREINDCRSLEELLRRYRFWDYE